MAFLTTTIGQYHVSNSFVDKLPSVTHGIPRPLPDERPRQSVANLIGRFEKQKSSSGAAVPPPTLPRTSSVSSYRTEDSAQEEVKERREWPPKSVESPAHLSLPGSGTLQLPVHKELTTPPESVPPPEPVEAKPPTSPPVTLVQPIPAIDGSPLPSQIKPTTTGLSSSFRSPAAKSAVKPSTATPVKSIAPLKPQDTGQSTASLAARKRVSATPKQPLSMTPSRVRTPTSTARSITPSSQARPKTPSSGLYAPTAASLARTRANALPPPSVEKPKRKLTTDLSKPTAASASKVRTPAATPARGGQLVAGKQSVKPITKPAIGKTTTLAKQSGSAKHPLSKTASSHTKISNAKKPSSSVGPVTNAVAAPIAMNSSETTIEEIIDSKPEDALDFVASAAGDAVQIGLEDAGQESKMHEDGSLKEECHVDEDSHTEEIENYDEDFLDESHAEVHEEHGNELVGANEVSSRGLDETSVVEEAHQQHDMEPEHTHDTNFHGLEEVHNHPDDVEDLRVQSPSASHDILADLHHPDDIEPDEGVEGPTEMSKMDPASVGNDLEDIVNLLESGPNIHRPSFETSSTVDAGEIPDEY